MVNAPETFILPYPVLPVRPGDPEFLLTPTENNENKSKLLNLQKLLKNPRSCRPELQVFIWFLNHILNCLIKLERAPYNRIQRADVQRDLNCRLIAEEVLIRVIEGGEEVNQVLLNMARKYNITIVIAPLSRLNAR